LGFFHFLLPAVASDKAYQLLAHGRWFSPASSTTKTDRHDIPEILLKVCINHWKVLYKLCAFYVDRNSKMTTTAGHSFYIGPIVFFYNQVNDTGS
jgi:hypothetical protein